jgi:hypothetical protein
MATADLLNEQQLLEQEYDRVVREDIELFRSTLILDGARDHRRSVRAQRLRRGSLRAAPGSVHMIRTKVPGGRLTSRANAPDGASRTDSAAARDT